MTPKQRLRRTIVEVIESQGGRHDELAIYGGEPGDPGLAGGPASLSWEIHGDLASLVLGGPAAILMEVLHPSVMAGVFAQSSYRTQTLRRARNTLGYVLGTTFGSTLAATRLIQRVKSIHSRINGLRPDGVAYRALNPELITWVHTCIPWAVMAAFERSVRRLTREEKNRYLTEQAPIGRLAGANDVPESVDALSTYMESMRPKLAVTEQTREFIRFLDGDDQGLKSLERADRWFSLRSSMSLMPEWAQELTATRQPASLQRQLFPLADRGRARLIRWAYPVLPCKQLALQRVRGESAACVDQYSANASSV